MSDISHAERRRRRVKRLKRMIVSAFFLMITIPVAGCIWLACKLHMVENQLSEMTAQYEAQLKITDDMQLRINELNRADAKGIDTAEYGVDVKDWVDVATIRADEPRKVYLTFDDGPSYYTTQILDILDRYGVKATFFVTGEEADSNPERYKEIVNRGHTLGMHSYSHVYSDVYKSKANFIKDYNKLRKYLIDTTGVTPKFYRFPGGSSNTVSGTDMDELCEFIENQGMVYFDWNVSSGDATNPMLAKDVIVANCVDSVSRHESSVILLHDTGTKYSTVQALPTIIEKIQAMDDTVILPITEDTEVVQHKKLITVEEN